MRRPAARGRRLFEAVQALVDQGREGTAGREQLRVASGVHDAALAQYP